MLLFSAHYVEYQKHFLLHGNNRPKDSTVKNQPPPLPYESHEKLRLVNHNHQGAVLNRQAAQKEALRFLQLQPESPVGFRHLHRNSSFSSLKTKTG